MAKRKPKARVEAEPTPGTNTVNRFHLNLSSNQSRVAGFGYTLEQIHNVIDVDRVCRAAHDAATFTDKHRASVRGALSHCWDMATKDELSPSVAVVGEELDCLKAYVDAVTVRLADEIEAASPTTQAVGTLIRQGLYQAGLSMDTVQTNLGGLAHAVESARKELPQAKKGVKPDDAVLDLISELHSIYQEAGGGGTLKTEFVEMVTEAMLELHRLAEVLHHPELFRLFSDTGTRGKIQRAIPGRNEET